MKVFDYMILCLLLSSCATTAPNQPPIETEEAKPGAALVSEALNKYLHEAYSDTSAVDVHYISNRALVSDKPTCSDQSFSVNIGQKANFGICKVNVPKRHQVGTIEVASTPRADTHRYFKFINHRAIENQESLGVVLKAKNAPELLLFVHGFNVKFEEANFRAAQIAYDVKFQGPVLVFTWPAGGDGGFLNSALINRTYSQNLQNAKATIAAFAEFLKYLASLKIKIHIMVHSMGHQVVIPALSLLGQEFHEKIIGELIFNAPDFSVDEFADKAPTFKNIAERITLYCSYNDKAISASETYNGGRRMGACERVDGVDVINVGEIDAPTLGVGGLGHGYYASRPILADLYQVLLHINAEKRLFIRKSEPNATEDFFMRP